MRLSIYFLIGVIALAIGIAYFWNKGSSPKVTLVKDKNMSEIIKLKTSDNIQIVGDYYDANSDQGVLLLHMMPADRKSWIKFAKKLQANNFKVLAVDLRGHGESTTQVTSDKLRVTKDYRKFTDEEHQKSIFDVEAASEFLKSKGVKSLHLVGASIGANLALKYLSEHSEARSAVLLSPGLDYRGVKTSGLLVKLKENQAVYAVSSEDDKYSFDSVNKLFEGAQFSDSRMIKIFKNAGHGTTIFEKEPEFTNEIIFWIKRVGLR